LLIKEGIPAEVVSERRASCCSTGGPGDLDPTTVELLAAWRTWQTTEPPAAGLDLTEWMFTGRR
jgi:hypothetical protein